MTMSLTETMKCTHKRVA